MEAIGRAANITKSIVIMLCLTSATARAQDLKGASLHLDMAGKHQATGIVIPLVCGALAIGMASQMTDSQGPALIAGMGLCVGVGFNLSAAGHTRKAAKHLLP